MERIFLITGAGGFIGANLSRRLVSQGEEVHIFLKQKTRTWRLDDIIDKMHVHIVDLCDAQKLKALVNSIRPTIIYHLATHGAYHYQTDVEAIFRVNVLGFWYLLQACNNVGYELFINTGSSSEYGNKQFAMRETDLLTPKSFYAVSKSAQSLLYQYCSLGSDLPIVTLRLFSVYGPYEEPTRLIPTLMMAIIEGKSMTMVSPHTVRDFIYIDDVVDAYLMIDKLKTLRGEILNVGTGVQTSLRQLIETAQDVSGRELNVRWETMEPRLWDTDVWVADISKIRRHTGFNKTTCIWQGLERSLFWFQEHADFYRKKF